MAKAKKPVMPTIEQSKWISRIARHPMMKSYANGEVKYSLICGDLVPQRTAETIIRNAWVRRAKDGLFPDDSQTYHATNPDGSMIVPA